MKPSEQPIHTPKMTDAAGRQAIPSGLLAWFACNPVAANLLMLLILIGGMAGYRVMDKEVFPRFNLQQVEVNVHYPGAGPLEIEESVCVHIEAEINDVSGIKMCQVSNGSTLKLNKAKAL